MLLRLYSKPVLYCIYASFWHTEKTSLTYCSWLNRGSSEIFFSFYLWPQPSAMQLGYFRHYWPYIYGIKSEIYEFEPPSGSSSILMEKITQHVALFFLRQNDGHRNENPTVPIIVNGALSVNGNCSWQCGLRLISCKRLSSSCTAGAIGLYSHLRL